jgi:serine/threonine protein kinase
MTSKLQQSESVRKELEATITTVITDPVRNFATQLQPEVGTILGRYILESTLGSGSCGTVYLAQHQKIRIPVAVKVMNLFALQNTSVILQQLRLEAFLLAQLNHPNIVRLWDFEDDPPFPYLVTEYVSGESLGDRLIREGTLSALEVVGIIMKVIDGLEAARQFGIAHRDVKPDNILLGKNGEVKVADLGLAIITDHRLRTKAPAELPYELAGTAAYLAPEQATAPGAVDHRADIYSLGATMYHVLTGQYPFPGARRTEVIRKHLNSPLTPPHEVNSAVPRYLSDVVVRMMAKSPDDRFEDYHSLKDALRI